MSPGHGPESTPALPVVSVDTGGTFTDLLLLDGGRLTALKVASTPADPAEAVLAGVRQLVGARPFLLLHGSTVATNALLERKGARVALITNRGFEDVIEIGRQNRPQLYALVGHRAPPLVARGDRHGISGRLGPDGTELAPLEPTELAALVMSTQGAHAIAIVLLHSYANPSHEQRVADALHAAHLPLSVSSALLPEYREYERASTTVVNAYVAPVVSRYLGRLAREAGAERVSVMGSNGGAVPIERALREPVHTVLSGPAGGVVGALAWATRAGFDSIVSFDMGGTSTDVSLAPGRPLHTREFEIAGAPVAVPVIDIHTVGAGGGSLARVDPGGALRVGPVSAGADPGPIAYGHGGTGVTVTDAHVWLGRLPTDALLGGARLLDRAAVAPPLQRLAAELGATMEETAEGVLAVADAAMERALRVISVERGYDPRDFALVAFGGAGGLHAAELTDRLGAARAMIPPHPGLLSAYGMLAAPVAREASRTVLVSTSGDGWEAEVEEGLTALAATAGAQLLEEDATREVVPIELHVDARYRGQSFELRVSADGPAGAWVGRFHTAHRERYGYDRRDAAVEAVTLRAIARAPGPPLEIAEIAPARTAPRPAPLELHFRGERIRARRIDRGELGAGARLAGPLVVTEYSATTWVPPGWTLEVDRWGILHLLRGAT
jgi:N-methylhydantoinase A